MKRSLHKIALAAFVLALAAVLLTVLAACSNEKQQKLSKECVRIHIRANSNSQQDQAVKLAVRDEITKYLSFALDGCDSKQAALRVLSNESEKLVQIANSTLYAHNFAYKASIRINREYFPDRNYDGYDFPAGDYDAVIIELGEGVGDNWWCVAFPPLCFVPADGKEKIVYRSWIKDMLDKLFG